MALPGVSLNPTIESQINQQNNYDDALAGYSMGQQATTIAGAGAQEAGALYSGALGAAEAPVQRSEGTRLNSSHTEQSRMPSSA